MVTFCHGPIWESFGTQPDLQSGLIATGRSAGLVDVSLNTKVNVVLLMCFYIL
jgi:hypothetical protein